MDQNSLTTEEAKKADIDELLKKLAADQKGLSSSEAEKRLQQYGPNEIQEKKVNPLLKFLRYFWGPIPWMIEAAVIMSAVIQRWPDFAIILTLLMVNAIVGSWQEHKAGNAIELLKKRLALKARVLRDGKWQETPAEKLVPGDIVRLRLGDIIPADVKLIDGDYLLTDESALTGESLPVEKHLSDIGYASSIVKQGEMNALVVNTAAKTFFGKTAKLVETSPNPKPLPKSHQQNRRLPDFPGDRTRNSNRSSLDFSRSKHLRHHSVCIDLNCCGDTCSTSRGPVSHHGHRRHSPRQEGSDR